MIWGSSCELNSSKKFMSRKNSVTFTENDFESAVTSFGSEERIASYAA
jgi:hypothetical protein